MKQGYTDLKPVLLHCYGKEYWMTFYELADLFSISIGFIASLCFCISTSDIKEKDIRTMSSNPFGVQPEFYYYLANQKGNYFAGGIFLCTALTIQLITKIGFLVDKDFDLPLNKSAWVIITLVVAVLLWFVGRKLKDYVVSNTK